MVSETEQREIVEFDPHLIRKLEVAFSRRNLQMAIDLINQAFNGRPPEQLTINSPVSLFFDTRLANTLEAMGIFTMLELGQCKSSLLLDHPQIGPQSMKKIRAAFVDKLGMKPKSEIQKSETGLI